MKHTCKEQGHTFEASKPPEGHDHIIEQDTCTACGKVRTITEDVYTPDPDDFYAGECGHEPDPDDPWS